MDSASLEFLIKEKSFENLLVVVSRNFIANFTYYTSIKLKNKS